VLLTNSNSTAPTATLNGSSLTFVRISGSINRAYYFVGYLANPTSGTFTMNWSPNANSDYTLLTVANAAQSSPIDTSYVTTVNSGTNLTTSVTTTQGNDLLLSFPVGSCEPRLFWLRCWRDTNNHCAGAAIRPIDGLVQKRRGNRRQREHDDQHLCFPADG